MSGKAGDPRGKSNPQYSMNMIVFSILFYSSVSLGIVFLNRALFSDALKFPVFVSWFQQFCGVFVYSLIGLVGQYVPALAFFPPYSFNWQTAKKVLPVTLSFVGMVGFSNTCLKNVQVSTYQVARSLTLLFSIIISKIVLNSSTSVKGLLACLVVISGFVIGSLDPSTLSLMGVITGSCASFFQAIYMVEIKRVLAHVDNDENVLMSYNLTLSSILFVPVIFIAGETGFYEALPFDLSQPNAIRTWVLLVASAAMGVLISVASYLCIKTTSPVTFNIVGYSKACLQSLGGIVLLNEAVSAKSMTGILLTLVGSFAYSQVKMAERKKEQSASRAEELIQLGNKLKGDRHHSHDKKHNASPMTTPVNLSHASGASLGESKKEHGDAGSTDSAGHSSRAVGQQGGAYLRSNSGGDRGKLHGSPYRDEEQGGKRRGS